MFSANQDELSATQTYFKRVEIFVDSPYLKHQLKLHTFLHYTQSDNMNVLN